MATGFTREETLNQYGITNTSEALSHLQDDNGRGFGTMLRSLSVPAMQAFTGLAASATQVAPYPGWVFGIATGGANKALIYDGAAGAGQVLVVYAATGIPTFTFGDGAVTDYDLWQAAMPEEIQAKLDEIPV
jgi:TM2 domain-containing membrane protein YozV